MSTCSEGCFRNVINLGNSIIGVSILAMPYCFQKCGILLSLVLIMASGLMTKASCHLLLKAAIMARRRNFEFLAFHTFGTLGKFTVELSIIGFLLGTCIAFFVVIGDLSPPLAAELFLLESSAQLRMEVLLFLGFFVALPLGLLRKVESLTSFSFLSVCFYIFLALKILGESLPNISSDVLWNQLHWWRPSGLLSTLPIFSMALSCQTQLFEIFDTLNEPSLKRMDTVVSSAVHMCSAVYSLVGIFGYIAFYDETISGNVLVKLSNSGLTEVVKIAFVVTVIVSFPLCLFPCRSSLHSLIYKQGISLHEMSGALLIPDQHFRLLTFGLVASTICAAILLPDIEFVLGILGSTIGTVICFILPALIFIKSTMKNTNERILAKVVFCIGIFILVACSYSTLHEQKSQENILPVEPLTSDIIPQQRAKPFLPKDNSDALIKEQFLKAKKEPDIIQPEKEEALLKIDKNKIVVPQVSPLPDKIKPALEKRQEPPVPQEPEDSKQEEDKKKLDVAAEVKNVVEHNTIKVVDVVINEPKKEVTEEKAAGDNSQADGGSQNDVHPDAIKKEDKEIGKSKEERKSFDDGQADKQEELLRKIEAQQKEQKKLLEEQRQLLQELKEHKESHALKSSPAPRPPQQQQAALPQQQQQQQAALPQQPQQEAALPQQPQQQAALPRQEQQAAKPQQPAADSQQQAAYSPQPAAQPQQQAAQPQQSKQAAIPQQKDQQHGAFPQPAEFPQQQARVPPPQQQASLPQQQGAIPQRQDKGALLPNEARQASANSEANYLKRDTNQINIPKFMPQVPKVVPVQNMPLPRRMTEGNGEPNKASVNERLDKEDVIKHSLSDPKVNALPDHRNIVDRKPLKVPSYNASVNALPQESKHEDELASQMKLDKKSLPNASRDKDGM